ncbi:MAG: HAMP domain-containing sensor histidine kinase [Candidatus Omnitrophica bacterium]|nr:HAMP domain-containing sensor histidine kinase [Candidatus Omnitrophota bacterium]MDD5670420.1 HAMP domain-containing sensor histidine kinase [Candidatus Omnitrophota bacterium]
MKETFADITPEKQLTDRIYWLINLRWIAILGVVSTVFVVSQIIRIPLLTKPLYGIALILAIYNALCVWGVTYFKVHLRYAAIKFVASLQIFLDLSCLAALIHFSGGVENPFYFYFIFHIIIAGILLSRFETYLMAAYAACLFMLMAVAEYRGYLAHHCLSGVFATSWHEYPAYLVGSSFVLTSTLLIAAYLTTSISARLRAHERSLQTANALLAEKDRIKSEYVLRVNHDIKEDLAAIHTCIEPVQKGITGPLNEGQKDLLRRVRERSKQLIVYVDALLEMTKLKLAEKLEKDLFFVPDFVKEISESIGTVAAERQIVFEVQLDPEVSKMNGMRVYMAEALLNLLKNALKYTPDKGRIVWEIRGEKDRLCMKISDTGIGISPEELPRVFEEFYRAKNAKAKVKKGTGLGLSIARKIVEMHQGKIWLESVLNQGTSVHLEFPASLSS